jgi:hypothetical protein
MNESEHLLDSLGFVQVLGRRILSGAFSAKNVLKRRNVQFSPLSSLPKVKSIQIVDNIIPRITAEEKRAQQQACQAVIHKREEAPR